MKIRVNKQIDELIKKAGINNWYNYSKIAIDDKTDISDLTDKEKCFK